MFQRQLHLASEQNETDFTITTKVCLGYFIEKHSVQKDSILVYNNHKWWQGFNLKTFL